VELDSVQSPSPDGGRIEAAIIGDGQNVVGMGGAVIRMIEVGE
jgi:hypothetical protein